MREVRRAESTIMAVIVTTAAYIAGGGDAAGLKDILRRVDRSALTRIARLYLKKSIAESDPSIYRGFIDRIAGLDPEAARSLPVP
ncbi:MAG: hypothetical protein V1774_11125 [Candidatus Eisenbacteria bacterium]